MLLALSDAGGIESTCLRSDLSLMTDLDISLTKPVADEVSQLAERYTRASGGGIAVINALGGRAETWMSRLPDSVRAGLDTATRAALEQAVKAAQASRSAVKDQPDWVNSAVSAAMGAAGGFGGGATSLAELPVTTTLLLRVIQGVAVEHGFDPSEENVAFDCVTVFASAGPLEADDGAETGFLAARMGLNGAAFQKILQIVAPRLAAALGQKLAAQAVPVLGAAAGAAINYTYTQYYREMAHIHFRLRRLAIEAHVPERVLVDELRRSMTKFLVADG